MSLLPPAIFLMGPTASGKTNAAVYLKQHLPVELISVDSALVFKDMNIGTAKPEPAVLKQAPHFLVDIIPPTSAYSAANFREDALALMHEITARGNIPVLVGGTMLYFKSLVSGLSGLPEADATMRAQIDTEAAAIGWPGMHAKLAQIDPETAARLMPNDMQRIQRALEVYAIAGETMTQLHAKQQAQTLPYRVLKVALIPSDRSVLHARIAIRFQQMLNDGLVEEVRVLLEKYPTLTMDSTSMRCVGYRQVLEYMQGQYSLEELCDRGIFATRQLAKRQLTWLRGMDDTLALDCLDAQLNTQVMKAVQNFLL
ncbi:tRNA isopentenyltransferase MiaA [Methylophilaceae bacterium 11]|nr:tRNA isopentenyltransferase MiaA [Methylophilaceae bacterium 11]